MGFQGFPNNPINLTPACTNWTLDNRRGIPGTWWRGYWAIIAFAGSDKPCSSFVGQRLSAKGRRRGSACCTLLDRLAKIIRGTMATGRKRPSLRPAGRLVMIFKKDTFPRTEPPGITGSGTSAVSYFSRLLERNSKSSKATALDGFSGSLGFSKRLQVASSTRGKKRKRSAVSGR